jgi:hypothetical protein
MGKAMVSATVGTERLPVRNGEHLSIADDPVQFASEVVHLLRRDIEGRNRLENNASRLCQKLLAGAMYLRTYMRLDGRPK